MVCVVPTNIPTDITLVPRVKLTSQIQLHRALCAIILAAHQTLVHASVLSLDPLENKALCSWTNHMSVLEPRPRGCGVRGDPCDQTPERCFGPHIDSKLPRRLYYNV